MSTPSRAQSEHRDFLLPFIVLTFGAVNQTLLGSTMLLQNDRTSAFDELRRCLFAKLSHAIVMQVGTEC